MHSNFRFLQPRVPSLPAMSVIRTIQFVRFNVIVLLGESVIALGLAGYASADDTLASARPDEVLTGVRTFFEKTALFDGSFRPGIDPNYKGFSDTAYSDL